jgi:hypothetical protein
MAERRETTDGRYFEVAVGEWGDSTNIDIVPEEVVDRYCAENGVGIVILGVEDWLGEIPDDGSSGKLN